MLRVVSSARLLRALRLTTGALAQTSANRMPLRAFWFALRPPARHSCSAKLLELLLEAIENLIGPEAHDLDFSFVPFCAGN
jgi:hypothetical protein